MRIPAALLLLLLLLFPKTRVAAGEGAESGGAHPESEYVRKLPDWARRFLREGAQRTGQAMGSARSIATLPPQAGEGTVK